MLKLKNNNTTTFARMMVFTCLSLAWCSLASAQQPYMDNVTTEQQPLVQQQEQTPTVVVTSPVAHNEVPVVQDVATVQQPNVVPPAQSAPGFWRKFGQGLKQVLLFPLRVIIFPFKIVYLPGIIFNKLFRKKTVPVLPPLDAQGANNQQQPSTSPSVQNVGPVATTQPASIVQQPTPGFFGRLTQIFKKTPVPYQKPDFKLWTETERWKFLQTQFNQLSHGPLQSYSYKPMLLAFGTFLALVLSSVLLFGIPRYEKPAKLWKEDETKKKDKDEKIKEEDSYYYKMRDFAAHAQANWQVPMIIFISFLVAMYVNSSSAIMRYFTKQSDVKDSETFGKLVCRFHRINRDIMPAKVAGFYEEAYKDFSDNNGTFKKISPEQQCQLEQFTKTLVNLSALHAQNSTAYGLDAVVKNENKWRECAEQVKFLYTQKSHSIFSMIDVHMPLIVSILFALVLSGILGASVATYCRDEDNEAFFQAFNTPFTKVFNSRNNTSTILKAKAIGLVQGGALLSCIYVTFKLVSWFLAKTNLFGHVRDQNDKLYALTAFVEQMDSCPVDDIEPLKQILEPLREHFRQDRTIGLSRHEAALLYDSLMAWKQK